MLGVMAFGFFRDILNRILGGEDETGVPFYDKIPEYTRRQNFVLMNPLRQGTGEYFKFPMPYGYSVFDYAGHQRGYGYLKICQAVARLIYYAFR